MGILPVVANHQDQVRAAPFSLPRRHSRLNAILTSFIGTGGDDGPMPRPDDRDRLATKRGIVLLLDRRKKGILVKMHDHPAVHHFTSIPFKIQFCSDVSYISSYMASPSVTE